MDPLESLDGQVADDSAPPSEPPRHGPWARSPEYGWVVWLEEDGIMWTRDDTRQGADAAGARVACLEAFLATHQPVGLLLDDRASSWGDTARAWSELEAFVDRHRRLRVAVVTSRPDVIAEVWDMRFRLRTRNLEIFRSPGVAQQWLRQGPLREPTA